jgi:uncharacterized protein (TIGR03663 family)
VDDLTEKLTVLIPVWNEEGVIGRLVEEVDRDVVRPLGSGEIIVVDDGSTDCTPEILAGLAAASENLRVVRLDPNRGHGAAVLEGLRLADGDWIFQLDSDGQFVVSEFWELWGRRSAADLVLGVRVRRQDPAHRIVLSRIVAASVTLLAVRRIRDPNVPFRLIRRTLWEDLAPLVRDDALAPSILTALGATVRGWRIAELPVTHLPRTRGRSSLHSWRLIWFGLRGLGELLRFRVELARRGTRARAVMAHFLEEIRVKRPVRISTPANRSGEEALAYAAVFLIALAFRLVSLGDRPLHHDESVHAWLAWRLYSGDGYAYDPTYHGPVQFYLYTIAYFVLGVGDTAVRAAPAVVGAGMTLLPLFIRAELGRTAALATAGLLAISPSYLYFSRFAREDIFVATITLALIVVTFRFLRGPERWHPAAILGLLAAGFATKETTYITVFVGGTFFLTVMSVQLARTQRHGLPATMAPLVSAVSAVGWKAWVWGVTAFSLVFTLLFSSFLFHPWGLRDGLHDSIGYWLSQQDVHRGDQPWFYYLFLLPAYELPIVALGLLGTAVSLCRPTLFRLFLVYDFALTLIVYSWAAERMPWLVLHPLLPLVLLAGIGLQALWCGRGGMPRAVPLAVALVSVTILAHGATAVSYHHSADPAEALVFTQNSTDVLPVRATIEALERHATAAGGHHALVVVDDWGGTSWPWAWYFRDVPVRYADLSRPTSIQGADAVVVAESNLTKLRPQLLRYDGYRFRLREWWVIDFEAFGPREFWRWFLHRKAWSPKGSQDEYLYIRRGASVGAAP